MELLRNMRWKNVRSDGSYVSKLPNLNSLHNLASFLTFMHDITSHQARAMCTRRGDILKEESSGDESQGRGCGLHDVDLCDRTVLGD